MALSGIEPAAFRLVAQCPSLKVTIPYAHMFDYWERHCGFQSQTSNINKKLSIRRISGEKISMRWDCAWPVYNKLTAWSTVLPQKLKNPQLVKKKKIPRILWNPNFHHRIYNSPPYVSVLSNSNPVHVSPIHFLNSHFNIILQSTSSSYT